MDIIRDVHGSKFLPQPDPDKPKEVYSLFSNVDYWSVCMLKSTRIWGVKVNIG